MIVRRSVSTLVLLLSFALVLAASRTHHSGRQNMPGGAMSPGTTHEMFAPFFFAGEYKSELILQNMRLDVPITVTPVLMVRQREVALDAVTMPAHSAASVDINAALSAHGLADTTGAVIIRYDFKTTGPVSAFVRSTDSAHSLYLNSVAWGREEYMGTTLDAVVWAPEPRTQGFISIVNTSSEMRQLHTTFLVKGQQEEQPVTNIGARQIVRISIDDLLDRTRHTGAGIHIAFSGMPGDIMAQGEILKKENGFAHSIRFVDKSLHFVGSALRSHFLLLGPQPQTDGFPLEVSFRSVAVVRDIDTTPIQLTPTIRYLQGEFVKTITLNPIVLGTGESRVLDFLEIQRDGLLPADLYQGTLELTPNTNLNSIIGELFTFNERTGGYALGSSFTAYPARGTESLWRTDGTFQTSIMIQNTATKADDVTLKFFSNAQTYETAIKLDPGAIKKISV